MLARHADDADAAAAPCRRRHATLIFRHDDIFDAAMMPF